MSAFGGKLRTVPTVRLLRNLHISSGKSQPSHLLSSIQSQYSALTVVALKKECKVRGLRVKGRKADLVDRIASFEAAKQFSSSAAVKAKGDASHIDFARLPEEKYQYRQSKPPQKMIVPPDATYSAPDIVPIEVRRRTIDASGTSEIHVVSGDKIISNMNPIEESIKNYEDADPLAIQDISGRDKGILWGLGLAIAAWWTAGSLFNRSDKAKH